MAATQVFGDSVNAELIGQLSVGQCVPTTASMVATLLADFNAKLAGALQLQASVTLTPPTLAASLEAALALVAALQAQIALSISLGLPEVSVDLTVMLSVIADLNASIAGLLTLQVALGTAGVYVIKHEGPSETHGPDVQQIVDNIAPPGNNVHSITLLATAPAVFEALGAVILTG